MRIITCTGYYSTGSSAITDLLSEYEGCCCQPDDYELRIIYDTDGLSDLEYHLVENHNRQNSGHAIKRFMRLARFYKGNFIAHKNEAFFNGHWMEYTKEYLCSLVELEYKGVWMYDYLDRGIGFYYFNSLLRKLFKKDLLVNEKTYCAYPTKTEFEQKTKEYLYRLFSVINKASAPYLIMDQLLPASDIKRYLGLLDDVKVVIVERDPRDIFFLEKYYRKSHVIPEDAEKFCKWFEYTRRHRKYENVNTDYSMLVNFEDLVYHYEDTVARVEQFTGLEDSNHLKIRNRFIPEKSVYNTQIWKRTILTPRQNAELNFIEQNLEEYLYDFPEIQIDADKKINIE